MKVNIDAFSWLRKINPKYWSVYAFKKSVNYDYTINNMIESQNAQLRAIRKAPIISLLEHIKKMMIQAIIERKIECQGWRTEVPSYINKNMKKLVNARRFCHVITTREVLFKVEDTNKS